MLQTEYIRSLNCNYERILLDRKPEEKRYQYCILGRGGIKGLLPCSLRYINGQAYLYYDISSRQNIFQLFGDRCITREWMRDFTWSLKKIRQELERFLLDTSNILWYPEHIFQDLESNIFSFLYVPYYEGEASFIKLVEFWVEHINYEDEGLVNCVYRMYEQMEQNGDVYLQSGIFEDLESLEKDMEKPGNVGEKNVRIAEKISDEEFSETEAKKTVLAAEEEKTRDLGQKETKTKEPRQKELKEKDSGRKQKNIFSIFEGKKEKNKKRRDDYTQEMQRAMTGYAAEETSYGGEDYGQTVYIEDKIDEEEKTHKLYSLEGKILAELDRPQTSIGKKMGEVNVVLDDSSVSRMHARIIREKENVYLEDLNSTNGTFKNGLRLQPYEKRKLEEEDEIKCGKAVIIFR